jgi:hypothetical protein
VEDDADAELVELGVAETLVAVDPLEAGFAA